MSYTYDTAGRLSTVTDAGGGVTTYTYNDQNQMVTIQDARGIVYLRIATLSSLGIGPAPVLGLFEMLAQRQPLSLIGRSNLGSVDFVGTPEQAPILQAA